MSTLYWIAFRPARPEKLSGNGTEVEQDVIVPEWDRWPGSGWPILAERVWCTKSQSSLLNIYFRLSGFQSSLLYTCLYCDEERQKPIRHAIIHFHDLRGAALLRNRNRAKITVPICEHIEALSGMFFLSDQ